MSKPTNNDKASSNVVCNLYPTKPPELMKLYYPIEEKEKEYNKMIKKDDDLQHDEPILEKLLREDHNNKNLSPGKYSNRESENQLSGERNSEMFDRNEVHVVFSHKLDVIDQIKTRKLMLPRHFQKFVYY